LGHRQQSRRDVDFSPQSCPGAFYNDITLVDDVLKMSGQNEQFYIRY
jgi:hypothetical protein